MIDILKFLGIFAIVVLLAVGWSLVIRYAGPAVKSVTFIPWVLSMAVAFAVVVLGTLTKALG